MMESKPTGRLLSLDFMRGLIMFLLALEACGLYENLRDAGKGSFLFSSFIGQFFHAGWHGMHFWDNIQPAFMFMAGVAMTYSLSKQIQLGVSWKDRFLKVLKRSALLLFWGIFKRINDAEWFALSALDVTDILTQLAFTSLIAFFLFNWRIRYLILACVGLLLLTELCYRFWDVPGFAGGFTPNQNFGNWVDWVLFAQKGNTYVFINWIPTAVHTISGVIVGKLLLTNRLSMRALVGTALLCIIGGYVLDLLAITPIIKPIATSAFMIASLGYCLLLIALFYWWIDIRGHQKGLLFFQVIGMNSIFIYLFFDIVGKKWFNGYVSMVLQPIWSSVGFQENLILILTSLVIFALEWYLCYFLYKKRIFFKL